MLSTCFHQIIIRKSFKIFVKVLFEKVKTNFEVVIVMQLGTPSLLIFWVGTKNGRHCAYNRFLSYEIDRNIFPILKCTW